MDKDKIKDWLKNPYNLVLIVVLIFVLIIRLHYFSLTMHQPLWWDEAEYMSTAKGFAGIIDFPYHFALNRFPGFQLTASLFYIFGITSEPVLRFFLAFIPSLIVLFLLYSIMREMYPDKKIAIISLVVFSVLWEHVFYSNRFHTENWSLIFSFLAILILFKVYIKKEKFYFIKPNHAIWYILLLSILCILFRSANIIFLPAVLFFILMLNFYKIPKNLRIILVIFLVSLFVLFLFIGGPLAKKYASINLFYHYEMPIAWNIISWDNSNVFYGFYQSFIPYVPSILFYAFLLGIILFFIKVIIAPELLKRVSLNSEELEIKSDIFNIILIIAVLFFFIFMFRQSVFEYRWFFILLPGMFAFTAKGIIKFSEYLASFINFKGLSILLILIIVILGIYTEYNHTDMVVKYKITSYQEVKDSGLWINQNSNKSDIIITESPMQHAYYSERKLFWFDQFNNEENFSEYLKEIKPKYIVLSVFQPHPEWAYSFPEKNNNTLKPVKAYFDSNQQPLLIIYEYNS